MKKRLVFIVCIVLYIFSVLACGVQAKEYLPLDSDKTIEYFSDGSYIITELSEYNSLDKSSISRSKTSTYYDNNNTSVWFVRLTATFSYNGTTATCTSSSTSYTIYDTAWQVTNAVASRSGNTATGDFTVKKYFLGIPIKTVNRTLTLTCSPSGVVT